MSQKRGGVTRNCEVCGREFKTKHCLIIQGKGRFCSKECQNIWQSENRKGRNNPAWNGAQKFYVDGNPICSNEHGLVVRVCQYCGKQFEVIPSEAKRGGGKFCSRVCVISYQRNKNHPQWKGGKDKRPSSFKKYTSTQKPRDKIIKDHPGYVYFLNADNGLYKIGRTKEFNKRIKNLGVKMPYELRLIMLIEADDMYWLEYQLHQQFADKRIRGEWFQLTRDDLDYAKGLSLGLFNLI